MADFNYSNHAVSQVKFSGNISKTDQDRDQQNTAFVVMNWNTDFLSYELAIQLLIVAILYFFLFTLIKEGIFTICFQIFLLLPSIPRLLTG